MQVKIAIVPTEDEKETVQSTVRVYDAQGILSEGDINLDKDALESTVTLPANGYIEVDDIGAPVVVDGEQFAAVPDTAEEVETRRRDHIKERRKLAREAAEADPLYMQDRLAAAGIAMPAAKPPTTPVEKKGETTADMSKTVSPTVGTSPKPPGIGGAPPSSPQSSPSQASTQPSRPPTSSPPRPVDRK